MTHPIVILVLVALLGVVAFPVQGDFHAYGFFNPSNKYREWFREIVWLQDTRIQEAKRSGTRLASAKDIAVKYPYPDKAFVMTEKRLVISGKENNN